MLKRLGMRKTAAPEALASYLAKQRLSQGAFARTVRVHRQAVSMLLSRASTPSLRLAVRIMEATGGEVRPETWVRP